MVKLGQCIISNVFVKHISKINTIEEIIWELAEISNRMEFCDPSYNKEDNVDHSFYNGVIIMKEEA